MSKVLIDREVLGRAVYAFTSLEKQLPVLRDKGIRWLRDELAATVQEMQAALQQPEVETLFWYRPVCNGEMYEGPVHHNSAEWKMLSEESPGEWLPLYAVHQPAQQPVATVSDVHMSRYTIEWTNGPLPEGASLYAAPQDDKAPQPAQQAVSKDRIREIFLAAGFTVKEGQTDLKPYVYEAAYALLNEAPQPAQPTPRYEPTDEGIGND